MAGTPPKGSQDSEHGIKEGQLAPALRFRKIRGTVTGHTACEGPLPWTCWVVGLASGEGAAGSRGWRAERATAGSSVPTTELSKGCSWRQHSCVPILFTMIPSIPQPYQACASAHLMYSTGSPAPNCAAPSLCLTLLSKGQSPPSDLHPRERPPGDPERFTSSRRRWHTGGSALTQ